MIGPRSLDILLSPPVAPDEPVGHTLSLDRSAPLPLKAIEDAIYDNPLLLSPFRAIRALIDTPDFVILPDEVTALEPEAARKAIELCKGEPLRGITILQAPAGPGATLHFAIPTDLAGFLRRTFYNITLSHPLSTLAAPLLASAAPGVVASMSDGRLHIAATDGARLLLANTFSYDAPADAAYYIAVVWRAVELPADANLFLHAGDDTAAIVDTLRRGAPQIPAPQGISSLAPITPLPRSAAALPLPILLNPRQ